jgi:hypothetical protein
LVRPLDWRCAGGGELDFAFSHCAPNVPDRVVGVNPACRFQVSAFSLSAFCFVQVEQRALGLLRARCNIDQAPNEMGSSRRSALFHLLSDQPMADPFSEI